MTHLIGKNILGFILVYYLLSNVTDELSFLIHMCTQERKQKALNGPSVAF